ncbi:MAG: hypothetical protein AAF577_05960 [Pseudomonadota bacterium]
MSGDTDAGPGAAVLALVEEGVALLERERRFCRSGRLSALADIASQKQAFAARLAEALGGLRPVSGDPVMPVLTRRVRALARAARRNERLLAAAREAVLRVRRARSAGEALRRGRVGYGPDGGDVLSRADASGPTRTA